MKDSVAVGLAVCFAFAIAAQGFAQEGEHSAGGQAGRDGAKMRAGPPRGGMWEGREGRFGGAGMGLGGGEEAMIGRLLANPKVAETLGLGEDQIKTLKDKLEGVRKDMEPLRADLEKASMDQAHLLTATQTVDEAAIMATVEKAGEIRTKIAKLMIQQLLTVKKTLKPEQIEKARAMIRERMNGAKGQGEGVGPGQWRRPRDRGARGPDEGQPPKGDGEKPLPPPPPEKAI